MKTLKNPESGFTLIEVLLALGLSAVIASAIYGLLWTGIGAWKRVRQRAELYQTARVVLDRMETDLQNGIPLSGGALKNTFPFAGANLEISFPAVTFMTDATQDSGQRLTPVRIAYRWMAATTAAPAQLIREWDVLGVAGVTAQNRHGREVFPSDIAGITFSYPLRQSAPESPRVLWSTQWEAGIKIPEAVRVELQLRQPDSGETLSLRKVIPLWQGTPRLKPVPS